MTVNGGERQRTIEKKSEERKKPWPRERWSWSRKKKREIEREKKLIPIVLFSILFHILKK